MSIWHATIGNGEEPLQGLVVGDEGEGSVLAVAEAADGPHTLLHEARCGGWLSNVL